MAQNYDIQIPAHPSIYLNDDAAAPERQLKIYFSAPDAGVNADTGLLLFIAGFGAASLSKVYQKMRRQFADDYNLVTIQCEYFGSEFMNDPNSMDLDVDDLRQVYSAEDMAAVLQSDHPYQTAMLLASKYNHRPLFLAHFPEENLSNFNDMGIMQALDNVSAVLAVMRVLTENQLSFNQNKIIIYGHSHGAYLGYLCNAFAPHLFSHLLDNSAWVFPMYLLQYRTLLVFNLVAQAEFRLQTHYFAKSQDYDRELLWLTSLYEKFNNHCQIIAYHGAGDELAALVDKQTFTRSVAGLDLRVVDENTLASMGDVFLTTEHGLGADFLQMFAMIEPEIQPRESSPPPCEIVTYSTSRARYLIDYRQGLPRLTVRSM